MKPTKCSVFIVLALVLLTLMGCGSKNEKMIQEDQMSMPVANGEVAESRMMKEYDDVELNSAAEFAAPTTPKDYSTNFMASKAADGTLDGNKVFIRTANLKFRVPNVVSATQAIEDIIIAKKGFIISSTLTNQSLYEDETRVSKDSILVQTHHSLTGVLTLRVHHTLLDGTLREIAPLAEHIEYRNVDANERTFQILSNNLEQARKKDKSARVKNISGPGKGHKLEDLLAAEESIDEARSEADAALVAEKEMYDEIEYSTISISLWQAPTVLSKMKLRTAEVREYKQGFLEGMGDAIAGGWYGLLLTIEALFAIWPLLLFVGGIVFAIIYWRKKKKQQH